MRTIGIIPARFASTRFPGKPLVEVLGRSMIQRVYEQALSAKVFDKIVVATDDERILLAVNAFGGEAVMTSTDHPSGTDRCKDALLQQKENYDIVVNIQGDEPFVSTDQIRLILSCFDQDSTDIATLIKPITNLAELEDPNRPKVIVDIEGFAIYFSRQAIPFVRAGSKKTWLDQTSFFKHIGMYAYRRDTLLQITEMKQTPLELSEGLEQLRWIENGLKIKTAVTEEESYCIDTPEDLKKIEERFSV